MHRDAPRPVSGKVPAMPVPPGHVELTCTRESCHAIYVVSVDLVPLLRDCTCPKCGRGVLQLRDHPVMTLR